MTKFDEVARRVHLNSKNHGFYQNKDMKDFTEQAAKLALVHSEITEIMEALRKEKGEREILDEISDVLIRTLDFYEALREAGVVKNSLDSAFDNKTRLNESRPFMHGVLG